MTEFNSKLTLYKNCKIREGYIIDDIELFLDYINQINKKDYDFQKVNFDHIRTSLNYIVQVDSVYADYTNLLRYNYGKIDIYKENEFGEQKEMTLYYFVESVRCCSLIGKYELVLKLDVLNTYKNLLSFNENTHVIREHRDRWDVLLYAQPIDTNEIYFLKNIYKDEIQSQNHELIDKIYLYSNRPISNYDYWVKLTVQDIEGVASYYCHFQYQYTVYDVAHPEGKTITSFTKMRTTTQQVGVVNYSILRYLQEYNQLIDFKIIPYPPFSVDYDLSIRAFDLPKDYEIKFHEYKFTVTVGSTSEEITLPLIKVVDNSLFSLNINENNVSLIEYRTGNYEQSLNNLYLRIFFVNKTVDQYKTLVNNPDNPENKNFFSLDYSKNIENFSNNEEPSVLGNGITEVKLDFNNTKYLIDLDFFNFNGDRSQVELLINEIVNVDILDPIINIAANTDLSSLENTLLFKILPTRYFKYNKEINFFEQSLTADVTRIRADYFEFNDRKKLLDIQRKADDDKLTLLQQSIEKEHGKDSAIYKGATYLLNRYRELRTKMRSFEDSGNIKNIIQGSGAVLSGLSGNFFRLFNYLGRQFSSSDNSNKVGISQGGYFKNLQKGYYKLSMSISQPDVKKYEKIFYITGNLVDEDKIPSHNSRVFFDYLQCVPVFNETLGVTSIMDSITNLYLNGVTYIHTYYKRGTIFPQWHFPEENLQNLEISLIDKINELYPD